MCGRFTLTASAQTVADFFGLVEVPTLTPRYNIAPTQPVAIVARAEKGRRLGWCRWGLIPSWANDPSIGNSLINASGDTAATKPSFRAAFKSRRCLVVADGFYEWQATGKGKKKQPYRFTMRDRKPFGIAGMWERWPNGDEDILSCCLITTDANAVVSPVHDRMPVILPQAAFDLWLGPAPPDLSRLQALLRPYAPEDMVATAVGLHVNNARFDDPMCIQGVEPQGKA
jgi:putative SOS response-associated peptidase YedK